MPLTPDEASRRIGGERTYNMRGPSRLYWLRPKKPLHTTRVIPCTSDCQLICNTRPKRTKPREAGRPPSRPWIVRWMSDSAQQDGMHQS